MITDAEWRETMGELAGRGLGFGQLLLLHAAGGSAVLGWACAAVALDSFERVGFDALTGIVMAVLTPVFLGLATLGVRRWTHRGQDVRDGLDDLADLGAERGEGFLAEPRLVVLVERPWRSGGWLALSCLLTVSGAWLTVRAGHESASSSVGGMVYSFGLGLTVGVTGVLGAIRAVAHLRWSACFLSPLAQRDAGGVHR
jgi:hypothetical protein